MSNGSNSCKTMVQTETFTNRWSIENFTHCKNEFLVSSQFSNGKQVAWYHRLWPNRYDRTYGYGYSVQLETMIIQCDKSTQHYGVFKAEILRNTQDKTPWVFNVSGPLVVDDKSGHISVLINRDDVMNEKNGYLTNNVLDLSIELAITQALPCQKIKNSPQIILPESQFFPNITSLFSDAKYSDVKITVGNKEFACHKAILAVRSSVFAAMFEHEMEESRQNRVVITDIEPEVFQELLRFIYTDQVYSLDQIAINLLAAADKYALDRLKAMCAQALLKNLSTESAINTLVIADMHHAEQLKRECIAFICKNGAIMKTKHWDNFLDNQRNLANEVLNEVLKQLKV